MKPSFKSVGILCLITASSLSCAGGGSSAAELVGAPTPPTASEVLGEAGYSKTDIAALVSFGAVNLAMFNQLSPVQVGGSPARMAPALNGFESCATFTSEDLYPDGAPDSIDDTFAYLFFDCPTPGSEASSTFSGNFDYDIAEDDGDTMAYLGAGCFGLYDLGIYGPADPTAIYGMMDITATNQSPNGGDLNTVGSLGIQSFGSVGVVGRFDGYTAFDLANQSIVDCFLEGCFYTGTVSADFFQVNILLEGQEGSEVDDLGIEMSPIPGSDGFNLVFMDGEDILMTGTVDPTNPDPEAAVQLDLPSDF